MLTFSSQNKVEVRTVVPVPRLEHLPTIPRSDRPRPRAVSNSPAFIMNVYLGSLKVIFYLVAWVCGVSFTSSPGLGDGMIYITYSEGVSYYETAPPLRVYSQKTFKQGISEKQPF